METQIDYTDTPFMVCEILRYGKDYKIITSGGSHNFYYLRTGDNCFYISDSFNYNNIVSIPNFNEYVFDQIELYLSSLETRLGFAKNVKSLVFFEIKKKRLLDDLKTGNTVFGKCINSLKKKFIWKHK